MVMKEWATKMQPFQLYIVLGLTIALFLVELIVSHLTHALTLLMDSYHTLCNIMALGGCIVTIKYARDDLGSRLRQESKDSPSGEQLTTSKSTCHDKKNSESNMTGANQERKLKNTFGWARTDVIFMLICCVFLASLSFSILVESVQTLIHIDHHDEMHHPISVLCLGAAGLLLNGVTYLLIGGYTFHQGSFLYVTESGDVILSRIVIDQSLQHGARRLSRSKTIHPKVVSPRQRQGIWEMTRDINGCVLVIICSIVVYFTDKTTAKYVDPILALISTGLIMVLSYPYMKESCLILLQTMPDTINIDALKVQLLNHFPDIVNIHDFHIWQLTANKVISTVHMIFQNPTVYKQVIEEVKEFFLENGITQVTIQPEFFKRNASMESVNSKYTSNCLVSCVEDGCKDNHCCLNYEDNNTIKIGTKEIIPDVLNSNLKTVRLSNDERTNWSTTSSKSSEADGQRNNGDSLETDSRQQSNDSLSIMDPPSYEKAFIDASDEVTKVKIDTKDISDLKINSTNKMNEIIVVNARCEDENKNMD